MHVIVKRYFIKEVSLGPSPTLRYYSFFFFAHDRKNVKIKKNPFPNEIRREN